MTAKKSSNKVDKEEVSHETEDEITGDGTGEALPPIDENNLTEQESVTGSGDIKMAQFRATGPGLLGVRRDRPGWLPVNARTDRLVKKGLLERVE